MSGLLNKLAAKGAKEAVNAVAEVVDKFVANPAEKEAAGFCEPSNSTKHILQLPAIDNFS